MQIRQNNNKGKKSKKTKSVKKKLFKLIKILLLLFLIAFIIVGAGALTIVYSYVKDAPDFDEGILPPSVTSYIFDNDGNEITRLYNEQNRIEIPLEQIPKHVQNAFIAIEDERFYEHFGVDPIAILRSFFINIRERRWGVQGGSTITQQLIKNAFLTPEKTNRRKVQEAWLAFNLERKYSKSEILEMYLNRIYFAHGAYGIEAAANTYFNKSANELTVAEGGLLAGVPRSPNFYSPYLNWNESMQRQSLVLNKMHEVGFISHRELVEAKEQEIILTDLQTREYPHPYFVDYVLHNELVNILLTMPEFSSREEAYEAIYNTGLKIYTTLDTKAQKATENVLSDESLYSQNIRVDMRRLKTLMAEGNYSRYPEETLSETGILQPQAAAVVANPVTGEVMALVGGRDYGKNNQDLRYLSRRQPGSAIKPLVTYAPAIEENMLTPGSILDDSPYIRGTWTPENFDRRFRGLITVREALVWSWNVPAVRAFEQLTPNIGMEYAKRMGLSTLHSDDFNLATTLGGLTHGVTAFDMAQAYAVLANQGIRIDFFTVKKIKDRNDQLIYEHRSEPEAVLSPQTAFLMTDILKDVVRRGTAGRLRIGYPVAAKTGTTNENRDAYLVSYTPEIVVSFWIGHDIPKLGTVAGGSGTPVTYMNALLPKIIEDLEPIDFVRPSGISGPISICNKSGLRPGPYCPSESIVSEIFPTGMVPQHNCNLHLEMEICTVSGLIPGNFCPDHEIETRTFLNRPDFELTDERWRGTVGRGPEDMGLMPPTNYCEEHSRPASEPIDFNVHLLIEPLRTLLEWQLHPDLIEYRIYRIKEGEEEASLLQKLPGSIGRYFDHTVERGVVYIYYLVGVNSEGVKSKPLEWVIFIPEDIQREDPPNDDNGNDVTAILPEQPQPGADNRGRGPKKPPP
ncbi:MAG: PBP1A family penicillin-binding protein [Bacillota bacterium]|nr:PBP1A family penicillin-binding protein [Bacillota bacterium]